jgi:epi-isozizaene 5-monooxygenase
MNAQVAIREPPLAGGAMPWLGHAAKLARDPLGFLESLRDHGDLVRIMFGPKPAYVVCSPELLRELLTADPDILIVGGPLWRALEPLLGQGLSTSNGAAHARQSRIVQQAFRRERIARYATVMTDEAQRLASSWQPEQVIDVSRSMFRLTVRIIARALLVTEAIEQKADAIGDALRIVFHGMHRQMLLSALPMSHLLVRGDRRYHSALAGLHQIVDDTIRHRRTASGHHDDLLSVLLNARDEESGTVLSGKEIHDQVITMLVGGTDTVAATLSWIFYMLSQHPGQEARLHREVDAVAAGGPIDMDHLDMLPHTRNVITESMRLRPATWVLNRRAAVDTELGGYRIPANADLFYSPYAMQRDHRSFERPLDFDPDRWNMNRAGQVPRYAMVPFSAGRRHCPGDHFSLTEMALTVATLAARWRLVPLPATDARTRVGINLQPRRLLMRVLPRVST